MFLNVVVVVLVGYLNEVIGFPAVVRDTTCLLLFSKLGLEELLSAGGTTRPRFTHIRDRVSVIYLICVEKMPRRSLLWFLIASI